MSGAGSSLDAGRLVPPVTGGKEPVRAAPAAGLYRQAMRRLRRNKVALLAGVVFLLIVACCLAAPLYASFIAHTGPDVNHITETIRVGGKNVDVVSPAVTPSSAGSPPRRSPWWSPWRSAWSPDTCAAGWTAC